VTGILVFVMVGLSAFLAPVLKVELLRLLTYSFLHRYSEVSKQVAFIERVSIAHRCTM